ncbi:unnamed protein product [Urochloa humidicola]
MRAGAYTIHQSLTAEAAAVLKLALALARRRGHAQVTPLHVAFALLTGPAGAGAGHPPHAAAAFSSASSPAAAPYGLLKRACLRSHPPSPAAAQQQQNPLQCRALELCFNVALNRLPTSGHHPHSPPPAVASHFAAPPLIQPSPTLSNALVAALKRAQANQRRGCVELQQPPPPPPASTTAASAAHQQNPPPLLAIKVELDQLVISILDDPSVSRVMREAGFSSATVKTNLEEEAALLPPPPPLPSSSSPPPPPIPPHFFLDAGRLPLWPAQFLALPPRGPTDACGDDDVRAVLDVMVRSRRSGGGGSGNPVIVGDSASMAEAVAGELLRRLERGEVPAELAGAHILRLQLSYVHVRLMSRADVDARAAELRRSVDAVQPNRGGGGGLVVFAGDLRWALDEEPAGGGGEHGVTASSYSPVEHMVAELGRLLDDLRAASRGRAWLVATASYQTYMRWQQRRRRRPQQMDSAWALQAVVVPTGSGTRLALNSLHPSTSSSSSSVHPSASGPLVPPAMATAQQLGQSPFAIAGDGHDETQLLLCTECSKNYAREASLVKAEAGAEGPRGSSLPAWLVPADQTPQHKEKYLIELKRKWSRLCRKLHLCAAADPCSAPCPWWSGSCMLPNSHSKPSVAAFLGLEGLMMEHGRSTTTTSHRPPSPPLLRWGPSPPTAPATALALATHPLSDSATSDASAAAARELERRLRRNIPWQPAAVAAEIAEAVVAGGKGAAAAWLYVKGTDGAAARRIAAVIAEARCGGAGRVVFADLGRFSCAEELWSDVVSRASRIGGGGGRKFVLFVDDVENAPCDVVDCLAAASRTGCLKDHRTGKELDLSGSVVILTMAKLAAGDEGGVIGLRLWAEDEAASGGAVKRKTESSSPESECKRARHDALDLDLNLCAEENADAGDDDAAEEDDDGGSDGDDEEEAVPSDITHEGDDESGDSTENGHARGVLESVAARVVTLDGDGGSGAAAAGIRARLAGAIAGQGRVEEAAVRALAAASAEFMEEVLERWAAEVLAPAAVTVRNGGKGKAMVVVLGLGPVGGARETEGFMGSVLPSRVHVD